MSDISITAANVVPSSLARRIKGLAGATIAAGETVYRDTATQNFLLSDGNDSTKMPVVGIAINSASAGQPLEIVESDPALAIGTHGVVIGTALYQSANPGKICPIADVASGNYTTVVMVSRSSTTVAFGILGGAAALGS